MLNAKVNNLRASPHFTIFFVPQQKQSVPFARTPALSSNSGSPSAVHKKRIQRYSLDMKRATKTLVLLIVFDRISVRGGT